MPQQTFEITAPNGKVLEITGDRMPNEGEIRSIFMKAGVDVRPPQPKQPGLATIGDQLEAKGRNPLVDVGVGALKGVGNTVYGMGKLVHDYTPIGRISDAIQPGAFDQKPPEIVPNNTAQRIGYTGEQVGEFMLPISALSKAGKAAQVARSVAQTMMQTGSPTEAAISGGLTAVLPGGSAAKRAAGALDTSAEKSVAQALGATKEWAKSDAARLAPEMIERGVKGSRSAMLAQAKSQAAAVGNELNAAYKAAADAGETVSGPVIRGTLQKTVNALKVADANGNLITIPGTERVISKLGELHDFVVALGDDIPVDKAAQVKRVMDKIVDKAGLFGPKATASATDNADAWAVREAAGSFRELLNRNASIADLNKELGFWTGLKKVLKETEKRTQSQRGGITDAIRGGGGAIAGAMMGAMHGGPLESGLGAVLGQQVMQQVSKAIESPQFKTSVAAPLKSALADALASGHAGKVLDVTRKIAAATPAQVAR